MFLSVAWLAIAMKNRLDRAAGLAEECPHCFAILPLGSIGCPYCNEALG